MTLDDYDLDAADKLSLLIGRVCQADAELERAVRIKAIVLHVDEVLAGSRPLKRDLNQLVQMCRDALDTTELPIDHDVVRAALDEAVAAHEERNRVVHDQWLIVESGKLARVQTLPPYTLHFDASQQTLAEVEAVQRRLNAARQGIERALRPQ